MTGRNATIDISPSAARLTSSLRDIGYDFVTAIADIVDNSIEAKAKTISITTAYEAEHSWVRVTDDGHGMTPATLNEAMRFGTRRIYGAEELGKFGLGLKTASLSQCRKLTVVTRAAPKRGRIHIREIDLDHIAESDEWVAKAFERAGLPWQAQERLASSPGTVVLWRDLDRVFDGLNSVGGHARRRLNRLAVAARSHLGMVFHRFIEGEAGQAPLKISVNGETVEPWDPFARGEQTTQTLQRKRFTLGTMPGQEVIFSPFVLPHRSAFSTPAAFDRYAGPKKWNRQQGLYVYRSDRLIQAGGWAGLRSADEHTKYARAALDFKPPLDTMFKVNVAKMRVTLPPQLRAPLERSAAELVAAAQARYRRGELDSLANRPEVQGGTLPDLKTIGIVLRAAARETNEDEALDRIAERIGARSPEVTEALGWGG